jgi:hypothetical protein
MRSTVALNIAFNVCWGGNVAGDRDFVAVAKSKRSK